MSVIGPMFNVKSPLTSFNVNDFLNKIAPSKSLVSKILSNEPGNSSCFH